MEHLHINGLTIQGYTINHLFFEEEVTGIFARNKDITQSLLNILSGINKNKNTCKYQDQDIFDNKEYFRSRLYLDFTKKYLSTLKASYIEERMKYRFNIPFNKEIFIKIIKELNVRGETDISYIYRFTPAGNTFVNYAIAVALQREHIIINNPTVNLKIENDIKAISEGITNKKRFKSVILGLDRLSPFRNLLDKILLFTDFNTVAELNGNDTLIVFSEEYFPMENKLYFGDTVIVLNTFDREELRSFSRQKMEYKIISVYDLEYYLQEYL